MKPTWTRIDRYRTSALFQSLWSGLSPSGMQNMQTQLSFPARQSAYTPYRHHHSTETSSCCQSSEWRDTSSGWWQSDCVSVTAFKFCIWHCRPCQPADSCSWSVCTAVDGSALNWFKSYLSGRTQTFIVDGVRSQTATMDCSVHQGSVLEPLECISYTEEVAEVSVVML